MSLDEKQRKALIKSRGEPIPRLEFDVFKGNNVSMWTHFNHKDDFEKMKNCLEAVKDHLDQFIKDAEMCPFNKTELTKTQ